MRRVLFVLSWLACAGASGAETDDALAHLAAIDGFSCRFQQTIVHENGTQTKAEGTIMVRKGGMFRFSYDKPYAQLYISDGKSLWRYEPDLNVAERLRLDALSVDAWRLLTGGISSRDVELLEERPEKNGRWLTLRLRASGRIVRIRLRKGRPFQIVTRDALGGENRIVLSRCRWKAPGKHRFHFRPPPGVDLIDEGGDA